MLQVRDKGLVIITGCGHAGIVNIVRQAKRLTGVDSVYLVTGGLHLREGPVVTASVAALAEERPRLILPAHCTSWVAHRALLEAMPEAYRPNAVGSRIELRWDAVEDRRVHGGHDRIAIGGRSGRLQHVRGPGLGAGRPRLRRPDRRGGAAAERGHPRGRVRRSAFTGAGDRLRPGPPVRGCGRPRGPRRGAGHRPGHGGPSAAPLPAVEVRRGTAEELPFADGWFDAVVGNLVVLHLARPRAAVVEAARVLSPGGRLVLTTWDLPERCRLLGVMLEALATAGASASAEIPIGPAFFQFAHDAAFAELLSSAGFRGVSVRRIAFDQPVPTPEALWDGIIEGSVRTSALVRHQTAEVQAQARAALTEALAPYRSVAGEPGYRVPVSMKLVSGRRP